MNPPTPPFIAARWHGGPQVPRLRIVIHGTVSPCVRGGARNVARFFATENNKTSATYVVDPGEVIQCVGDHTVAYHAPPNQDTIGVELCDPQTGPGTRWGDRPHRQMLARGAELVAQLALAYGFPITKVTAAQLRGGRHGICGHADVSAAWHETTHTDPGPDFPWTHFVAAVHAAADVMAKPKKPPKHVAARPAVVTAAIRAVQKITPTGGRKPAKQAALKALRSIPKK